ncbi:hypothetical protein IAT40_001445 [Kwoniella sp. CBS 6097]
MSPPSFALLESPLLDIDDDIARLEYRGAGPRAGLSKEEKEDGTDYEQEPKPEPETERWEKVLWRRQPFPDNYVPPDFLSELKRLPPRPTPKVVPLFFAALPISLHLSIIAIFLSVFYDLLNDIMSPEQVTFGCVLFGLGGWGVYKLGWGVAKYRIKSSDRDLIPIIPAPTPLRSLILPPLLLSLLSPVLGTLTSATTSDSIWPLAAGLGFVHLLLADFGTGEDMRLKRRRERARRLNAEVEKGSRAAAFESGSISAAAMAMTGSGGGGGGGGGESVGRGRSRRGSVVLHEIEQEKSLTSSLSLTSALSASVVLASRLPSTAHVFSLILLSVLLFAGWPRIAKGVREAGRLFSLVLTISTAMLSISLFPTTPASSSSSFRILLPIPPSSFLSRGLGLNVSHSPLSTELIFTISLPTTPTSIFLLSLLVVNVIGPGMLIYAWRWKTRRGGGWDVAVVRIRKGRDG